LTVTPAYFESLGIPLLRGRDFTREDGPRRQGFGGQAPRDPGVVIVNRALASRAWPDTDPIGRRLKFGGPGSGNPWLTVVGVVGDARFLGLATPSEETMFVPLLHREQPLRQLTLVARTTLDPSSAARSIREALGRIDPELPLGDVQTMDALIARNVSRPRFQLALLVAFSVVSLGLAAIGIYGVVSHSVNARQREIGLRLALRADRANVVKLVVREGMARIFIGIAAGLALAVASTRLLTTFLYEVRALDPFTLAAAPLLLASVGLLATVLPARRAARVDPMVTLRVE